MPFAAAIPLIAMAVQAFANSRQGNKDREKAEDENSLDRELARERLQLDESMANPFRHQLNQARSLNMLGGMANSTYSRPQLTAQGAYGQSRPQMSGGFSFEPDPRSAGAARELYETVLAGRTRPEENRGGIDLLSLMNGGGYSDEMWRDDDPPTAVPRATAPRALPTPTGRAQAVSNARGYARG